MPHYPSRPTTGFAFGACMNSPEHSRLTRRECLAALASSAYFATRGCGADSTAQEDKGFEPIFDGETTRGWHANPKRIGHGTGGRWLVEDGVLTGEQNPPGSGDGGLLLSDRKFADFELLIDMHPDWGPDSGVFFRCTEAGAGFQLYVDYHDGGNVGHLRGEMPGAFAMKPFRITGQMNGGQRPVGFTTEPDPRAEKWPRGVYEYCCSPSDWLKAWRADGWNTARVRCVGKYPQITTWINDVRICHFNGEKSTLPEYDKERVFGILGRSGSIGLQVHGGKAWPVGAKCRWKNIHIREI